MRTFSPALTVMRLSLSRDSASGIPSAIPDSATIICSLRPTALARKRRMQATILRLRRARLKQIKCQAEYGIDRQSPVRKPRPRRLLVRLAAFRGWALFLRRRRDRVLLLRVVLHRGRSAAP